MRERSAAFGQRPGGRHVRLTIPARPEYISLSRLALSGLSRVRPLPEDTLADLKLALTEACSNSIRHAYEREGGGVEIQFEVGEDFLAVEVLDEGPGFDPSLPTSDPEALDEGGLGLAIIRAVSDTTEIGRRKDGRGSRLRFVKHLS